MCWLSSPQKGKEKEKEGVYRVLAGGCGRGFGYVKSAHEPEA